MKTLIGLSGLILVLGVVRAPGAERMYPVYPRQGKIVVDGKLDDEAWQGAPIANDFLTRLKNRDEIKPTRFKVLYDQANVYFGIELLEDRMDDLRLEKKDGEKVWQDDSVEIFLQDEQGPKWSRVAVNAAGKRSSLAAESQATRHEDRYILEIRIPFTVFGGTAKGGTSFWGNVCRNTLTSGEAIYGTWSPITSHYKETHHFGEFQMRHAPVSPEMAAAIGRFLNFVDSSEVVYGAEKMMERYGVFLSRAGKCPLPNKEAAGTVKEWRRKRHVAQRYIDFFHYFSENCVKPGLWEADHGKVLAKGEYPASNQFLMEVEVSEEEEELNTFFLMKALLASD